MCLTIYNDDVTNPTCINTRDTLLVMSTINKPLQVIPVIFNTPNNVQWNLK